MKARLCILFVALVAACGSDKQEPVPVSRLVIAPQTTILVRAGTPTSITLEAFGLDGGLITEPGVIAWTSNDPSTVSVDTNGGLTANKDLGSAQITASIGDVRSNSVLVVVAELSDGAVLIADSEFLGEVELVGSLPADPEEPWRLKAVLSKEHAVGSLLIAQGDTVFGGRVVSIESAGAGFETTVETVPLNGLFKNLSINETRPLVVTSSRSAGLLSQTNTLIGTSASAVTLGPFDCTVENGVSLTGLQFNVVPRKDVTGLSSNFIWTMVDNQTTDFEAIILGPLTVGLTGDIAIPAAFTSKIDCRAKLVEAPLFANTGIFGLIGVEAFITLGVGLEAGATTVGARVLVDGDLNIVVRTGFDRNPVTGEIWFLRDSEVDNQIKVGFDFDNGLADSSIATLSPVVSAGIGSQAFVGAGALRKVFEMAEWKASIARKIAYGTVNGQIQDAQFAASEKYELTVSYIIYEYGLGLMFGWLPGLLPALKVVLLELKGVVDLLSLIGFELPDNVFALGESPSGTFIGPDQVELGETADMTVTLDHVDDLGDYNVREVQIHSHSGVGSAFVSALVATIAPGAVGQTVFVWPFDSTAQGVGTQGYAAFVITDESPITPFEIASDSTKVIEVVDVAGKPPVEFLGSQSGGSLSCTTQMLIGGAFYRGDQDFQDLVVPLSTELQVTTMASCIAMTLEEGTTARANGTTTLAASATLNGNSLSSGRLAVAANLLISVQGKTSGNDHDLTAGYRFLGSQGFYFKVNERTVVRLDTRNMTGPDVSASLFCGNDMLLRMTEEGVRTATVPAGLDCVVGANAQMNSTGNSGTLSNFSIPASTSLEATLTFSQP